MVSINLGALHYFLDHIYGAFVHRTKLSTPFFSKGWGGSKLDLLESLVKQLFPVSEVQELPPIMVQPIWKMVWETKNACLREGTFRTPCEERLISALPPESYNARVAFLAPKLVPPQNMACVVHLAGMKFCLFILFLRMLVTSIKLKKLFNIFSMCKGDTTICLTYSCFTWFVLFF